MGVPGLLDLFAGTESEHILHLLWSFQVDSEPPSHPFTASITLGWEEGVAQSYRCAGEYQGQGATEVSEEDEGNDHPDDYPICLTTCALQQTQVADHQGDLEEADAELVNGPAGKIDPGI